MLVAMKKVKIYYKLFYFIISSLTLLQLSSCSSNNSNETSSEIINQTIFGLSNFLENEGSLTKDQINSIVLSAENQIELDSLENSEIPSEILPSLMHGSLVGLANDPLMNDDTRLDGVELIVAYFTRSLGDLSEVVGHYNFTNYFIRLHRFDSEATLGKLTKAALNALKLTGLSESMIDDGIAIVLNSVVINLDKAKLTNIISAVELVINISIQETQLNEEVGHGKFLSILSHSITNGIFNLNTSVKTINLIEAIENISFSLINNLNIYNDHNQFYTFESIIKSNMQIVIDEQLNLNFDSKNNLKEAILSTPNLIQDILIEKYDFAPLTFSISFQSDRAVQISYKVLPKDNKSVEYENTSFQDIKNDWRLNIIGLFPNYNNNIELTLKTSKGLKKSIKFNIITDPLIDDLPKINTNIITKTENRFYLVNYFGFAQSKNNPRPMDPFIFDKNGEIRWYLNFENHNSFRNLNYDNGLVQLRNGNFVMGDRSTNKIYEINYAGEILNTWGLQGYYFHHHVYEKPNGNFLVTSEDPNRSTVEDIIVEIDRDHGGFVCEWDQTQSLDPLRQAWPNIR